MRAKEPFTLIRKKLPSGRKVWYYRTYDKNGVRTAARSTGETTRAAAYLRIMALYKAGRLSGAGADVPTFRQFAFSFWDWEASPFLTEERSAGKVRSRRTCDNNARITASILIPSIGDKRLDMVTTRDVQSVMDTVRRRGASNATANKYAGVLSAMMGEARRLGYITSNPADNVMWCGNDSIPRGILTKEEVCAIFSGKVKWGNPLYKIANELAACTGMRLGEVLALRGEHVKADCIEIAENWRGIKYGLGRTKTGIVHSLPLPKQLMEELHIAKFPNDKKFIFSDTGENPFDGKTIRNAFYSALEQIGINKEERKKRNIVFHSWRHYVASRLAEANISDEKRMKVTGHQNLGMLEHYTHLDADALRDIVKVTGEFYASSDGEKKQK